MGFGIGIGSLTRPAANYGVAEGEGITLLAADRSRVVDGSFDDIAWLTTNPAGTVLYATIEKTGAPQSFVAAFAVDRLRHLGSQPTAGNEACHATLTENGQFLLVANYNGEFPLDLPDHAVSVFPVLQDGALGVVVSSVRHTGDGPNHNRQKRAHAHCVAQRPGSDEIYVADLGMDRLVAYDLEAGQLRVAPTRDVFFAPGTGPRHMVFSPDGARLFVVSELIPKVFSFAFDPAGVAVKVAEFAIAGDKVQPAGIILTPDGRHLIVSLRGCDELLGLRTDGLIQTGRWPCGGRTPRDLALAPDGQLVVANQDSSQITIFAFDPVQGLLGPVLSRIPVGTPMSIALIPNVSGAQ